ncbi:hypothetical protein P167DRAFT_62963 [Morchella conica CCBAS932]|uniref:Uncharacterized protein n=1 Tax=Morchella conica CCBAS932 TaxID=1392247 RepID=A0A3N4KXX4_9PEZI|nr:hypothetical protein P167DRAFT_62963 [Morchella conica CCBAS932]
MRRIALRIWGFDLFTYCNGLGSLWGGIAIVFQPLIKSFFLFFLFFHFRASITLATRTSFNLVISCFSLLYS